MMSYGQDVAQQLTAGAIGPSTSGMSGCSTCEDHRTTDFVMSGSRRPRFFALPPAHLPVVNEETDGASLRSNSQFLGRSSVGNAKYRVYKGRVLHSDRQPQSIRSPQWNWPI